MTSLRWLGAVVLGLGFVAGCPSAPKEVPNPVASPDAVATLKAKYAALKDTLVGEVVAVAADMASVEGIKAEALPKDAILQIIDPATDQVVRNATVQESTPGGRLVLHVEQVGQREARVGDIVVWMK